MLELTSLDQVDNGILHSPDVIEPPQELIGQLLVRDLSPDRDLPLDGLFDLLDDRHEFLWRLDAGLDSGGESVEGRDLWG